MIDNNRLIATGVLAVGLLVSCVGRGQDNKVLLQEGQPLLSVKKIAGGIKQVRQLQESVDAGDFYQTPSGPRKLYRLSGRFAVRGQGGKNAVETLAPLAVKGQMFAGYTQTAVGQDTLVLSTPETKEIGQKMRKVDKTDAVSARAALREIRQSAGIRIDPVFIDPDSGLQRIVGTDIIVCLKPSVDAKTYFGDELAHASPMPGTKNQYILTLDKDSAEAVLEDCLKRAADERVEWAEPDFQGEIIKNYTPNDTYFSSQWHLKGTGTGSVQAQTAWDTAKGNGIVIAIVDDGVQVAHPDLQANIFVNSGEIAGNGIDDDGNGYADDVSGWNFAEGTVSVSPADAEDSHGTAVAGVAAAVGNNGAGVAGVAFCSKILPVKMSTGTNDFATSSEIAAAFRYAAGLTGNGWQGADVINFSWSYSQSTTLDSALTAAATNGRGGKGCPIFVSSGNKASGWYSYGIPIPSSGTHTLKFEYAKDSSDFAGLDTVWIDDVYLPGIGTESFEGTTFPPSGWSTGGHSSWAQNTDRLYVRGTGVKSVRSGTLNNSQTNYLQVTKTFSAGTASFYLWTSTEANYDVVNIYFDGVKLGTDPGGVNEYLTPISYPASHESTIAVGASTDYDYRSDYSQYGTGLDFIAPSGGGTSGIYTTDRTGTDGYSSSSYTSDFSGTSSASPLAAGIGALILSKNPSLTASEVRSIMRKSCAKIGGVTYSGGDSGAGGWNTYYGYGRITASTAIANTPAVSTPPSAPTGVSASDGASTANVGISWTASSGATGYSVYRGTSSSSSSSSLLGSASGTSYTDSTATPGTLYYYWVKASNGAGTSGFSSSDTGYRALSAPSGVSATDTASDAVTVSWSAVPGASYYRVYRATSSGGTKTALGSWQTGLSYSDTSATAGTTYYYWVAAAVDNSGTRASAYSSYDTGIRIVTVALGTALDNTSLTWTTGGNANWFGQTATTYDGVDAAQSGDIGDSQTNWLQTTVTGPGTLSFWWKVSSESGWDYLRFRVDGADQWSMSGTSNWTQRTASITAGTHTLQWAYSKDGSVSSGSDCGWVDQVVWTPSAMAHDLNYYTPAGWPSGFFLSNSSTGLTSMTSFATSETICLSYAVMDDEANDITDNFTNRFSVVISGNTYTLNSAVVGGLSGGYYSYLDGYQWSALQGLTPGTYTATCVLNYGNILAENDYGNNSRSITFTVNAVVPSAPTGVSVGDGASTTGVTVTWTASSGATSYSVYRYTSNSPSSASLLGSASGTSYTDSTATPGVLYYYWVKAANSAGTSGFSSSDTGYRALSAPASVSASDVSPDTVTVTWGSVTGASYYRVYRATTSTGTKTALGSWQTALSYPDTSATAGTTYYYWVAAAVDSSGTRPSAYSLYDTGYRALPALTLPYSESFESGLGGWQASSGNDGDWRTLSGATSSTGTGPDGASDGSYYAYVESSTGTGDVGYPSKTAAMETVFDFSSISAPVLSFDYHMYGAAMGTLNVDIYDGAWHNAVWSRSGQQQTSGSDAWTEATVDLSVYAGDSGVKIRFRGVTGTSYTSDMAVDNVRLINSVAPPATVFVTNVVATPRWPWNGKVDIAYTVVSSDPNADVAVSFSGRDADRDIIVPVHTLTGDVGTVKPGPRRAVWDAAADAPGTNAAAFALTVTVALAPPPTDGTYLVVDLSGGSGATSYPVTYLDAVPSGGWTDEYKTTKLVLRRVPAGTFTMGSPSGELGRSNDETQHTVTLTKSFYIGVFELTQRQWELVMGNRPSYFNNSAYYAARPVEQVSYDVIRGSSAGAGWPADGLVDADSFIGRLRAKTGLASFDLPTEAQWEYACRAGTTTALNSGNNLTNTTNDANMANVGRYYHNGGAGYSQSCAPSAGTATVGSYLPNAWGLYDMHGNVYERCLDWYGTYPGSVIDPSGAASGNFRLYRGGCWTFDQAIFCRSGFRGYMYAYPSVESSDSLFGLRVLALPVVQ